MKIEIKDGMLYWAYDYKGNLVKRNWTGGEYVLYTTEQSAIDDRVNALQNLIKELNDKLYKATHG